MITVFYGAFLPWISRDSPKRVILASNVAFSPADHLWPGGLLLIRMLMLWTYANRFGTHGKSFAEFWSLMKLIESQI